MPYELVSPRVGYSKYWRVRGTEHGVYVDRSTGFSGKREASQFLAKCRDEAKRSALTKPTDDELTFSAAAISYMQSGGEKRFLTPILNHFAETPLSRVDQSAIDRAAVVLYPDAMPATRNRQVYSPISAMLRHAGVSMPLRRPRGAHSGRRVEWLRQEQAFALLEAATAVHRRLGALVTFLLYTGPRLSEALRLEWVDVDMVGATALLRQTKNGSPLTLHLPPAVMSELEALPRDGATVFGLTKSGRLYHLWAVAEERAGLSLPHRSAFHILRHTHATWRRLHAGADTAALVETGLWKSRAAASRYEHLDATEESRKSNLLPTSTR